MSRPLRRSRCARCSATLDLARAAGVVLALWLCSSGYHAEAASALWNANPASGEWNDPLNWVPMTVPNGPSDSATLGFSNRTDLFLSANTEVDGIVFNPGASAYTITARNNVALILSGAGITNASPFAQNFLADVDSDGNSGNIRFVQNSSAGGSSIFTVNGALVGASAGARGGSLDFFDRSSANMAVFVINGGAAAGAYGGSATFYNRASAGNGIFTNNAASVSGADAGLVEFYGNSTATKGAFTNQGAAFGNPGDLGAQMRFHDNSTAGNGTFSNNGGQVFRAGGSLIRFLDDSTAGAAIFVNYGGMAPQTTGGATGFYDAASAQNAMFVNNGGTPGAFSGGSTVFHAHSSAGSATLIANEGSGGGPGGQILFGEASSGGLAHIGLFGNGNLDISSHYAPGMTIGSIEGTGIVFLGSNNLTVGSNDRSTSFSGVIRDGGYFDPAATGGSLTKTGTGLLALTGANIYTGPTTVNDGTLIVNGSITSAVTVNGGTLGGAGTIQDVEITGPGTLSPGNSVGILNVAGSLTLALGATCLVDLNGTAAGSQYDQIDVTGTVSLVDAFLVLSLGFTPRVGDQFTIINNHGIDAVTGVFAGLPEGSTFTADRQSFMITYRGNTGNDIVLTATIPEPPPLALLLVGAAVLVSKIVQQRTLKPQFLARPSHNAKHPQI